MRARFLHYTKPERPSNDNHDPVIGERVMVRLQLNAIDNQQSLPRPNSQKVAFHQSSQDQVEAAAFTVGHDMFCVNLGTGSVFRAGIYRGLGGWDYHPHQHPEYLGKMGDLLSTLCAPTRPKGIIKPSARQAFQAQGRGLGTDIQLKQGQSSANRDLGAKLALIQQRMAQPVLATRAPKTV